MGFLFLIFMIIEWIFITLSEVILTIIVIFFAILDWIIRKFN